jgi:hypothetical protein
MRINGRFAKTTVYSGRSWEGKDQMMKGAKKGDLWVRARITREDLREKVSAGLAFNSIQYANEPRQLYETSVRLTVQPGTP